MEEKNIIGRNSFVTTSVFVATFLLIGIPLWWKTTNVYRYPVSYTECRSLLLENVRHSVPVKLILEDRSVSQGQLWEELLLPSSYKNKETAQPIVTFHFSMSSVSEEEQDIINRSNDIVDLDSSFNQQYVNQKEENVGSLEILVLNRNYSQGPKFTIGKGRMGYIVNNEDFINLAHDINLLAKRMVQVERLQKLYTPASSYGADKVPDKNRMRYLRSSKQFGITFSLIVPEPQFLEVHWEIEKAVNVYLKEVLREVKKVSTVTVKSQVLYMTSLPIPTEVSTSEKGKEYTINSEHLPLVNSIEAKLGSDISVHPNLNFVLYIPTRGQTPLRIRDSKGQLLDSNAFLLPQWGGFMIYNCPIPDNSSLPHQVALDSRAFMEVFLAQLRLLLGLPERSDLIEDNFQVLSGAVINKWETDFLLRKNAQEQISASISSLSSLSQLLQTISNIVITDDVGQKIHFALSSTKESLKLLSDGNLLDGFERAQSAFVASDEAFFDPSLLALLYFPEDQKYAIYIPLFLPISIPVLTSLAHLWKYWKHLKAKKDKIE